MKEIERNKMMIWFFLIFISRFIWKWLDDEDKRK
jgi:hypothetical protein